MAEPSVRLAAIRYERHFDIDGLLGSLVVRLRSAGVSVGGVLQQAIGEDRPSLALFDLRTGERGRITQYRGKGSAGCKLDPAGLAALSHCLSDAILDRVDLLVVNRFGRSEAQGGGFRFCIADAISAGVPVLTSVREPYLGAWEMFHAGYGVDLQPGDGVFEAVIELCCAGQRGIEIPVVSQFEFS